MRWLVRCLCGREKIVLQRSIKSGNTGSCAQPGCKIDSKRKDLMLITSGDRTLPLNVWARELGMFPQTMRRRWLHGVRGDALLALTPRRIRKAKADAELAAAELAGQPKDGGA